jgi:hypothetical protein
MSKLPLDTHRRRQFYWIKSACKRLRMQICLTASAMSRPLLTLEQMSMATQKAEACLEILLRWQDELSNAYLVCVCVCVCKHEFMILFSGPVHAYSYGRLHMSRNDSFRHTVWSESVTFGVVNNSQSLLNEICRSNLFSYRITTGN